jgi:hypothetical protein
MNRRFFLTILALVAPLLPAAAASANTPASKDTACYEMRIYTAAPGKLDDLHNRFRNHTLALFKKHGIESIGYWMPVDTNDLRLHYLLRYPSKEARDASWKAFFADPDWQAAYKASEANGALLAKAPESFFLQATDYSPTVRTGNVTDGGVFELRTYTTGPGLLPNLDARFRDHTVQLFDQHGIKSYGYWHKMPNQPAADVTLVYLVTHKSQEGAKASFGAFGKDPAWIAAKEASEKAAGGSLTVKDGVKSVFLKPTDYSPTK